MKVVDFISGDVLLANPTFGMLNHSYNLGEKKKKKKNSKSMIISLTVLHRYINAQSTTGYAS